MNKMILWNDWKFFTNGYTHVLKLRLIVDLMSQVLYFGTSIHSMHFPWSKIFSLNFPTLGQAHQPIIFIATGHVVLTTIKMAKRVIYDVRVSNVQKCCCSKMET